jgi:hypothetical protein
MEMEIKWKLKKKEWKDGPQLLENISISCEHTEDSFEKLDC